MVEQAIDERRRAHPVLRAVLQQGGRGLDGGGGQTRVCGEGVEKAFELEVWAERVRGPGSRDGSELGRHAGSAVAGSYAIFESDSQTFAESVTSDVVLTWCHRTASYDSEGRTDQG